MEFILSVFQFIQGFLGVAVVMPIVIFILGLCFKQVLVKLTLINCCGIGLNLVTNYC